MTKGDLQKFCSRDKTRLNINTPWSVGEYTYATNGHVILRVPRLPDVPENVVAPKVVIEGDPASLFPYAEPPEWFPFDAIDLPKPETQPCATCDGKGKNFECPECDGSGEVEYSGRKASWTIDCELCHGGGELDECVDCFGTGKFTPPKPIPVGGSHFNLEYLIWLKELPGCRVGPDADPLKQAPFQFDGGDGLLMPMKASQSWRETA